MNPAQYSYYQQSGPQNMGGQHMSAASGGFVSLQIHNGGAYYAHPPAAPNQGQYYGPQRSYGQAYPPQTPAPVQRPAYVVPPAAPVAYQAGNTIGMQAPQQFPAQAFAAHPGRPCKFWNRFQGEDQRVYRELCNYAYQRSGICCSLVGEDVTRKSIADYKSGESGDQAKDQAKAKNNFHRRAQKNESQQKNRAMKVDAKWEADLQRETLTHLAQTLVDQAQQASSFRAAPNDAGMPAMGQGAGPAMQHPYPQNAVQQPADQLQPQAPHQGNGLFFDPTVDPDLLFNLNVPIGAYPAGLDFQQ